MGPEGSNLKLSENDQDFWVLDKMHYRKDGFFVDIGAGDGVTGSNTFILPVNVPVNSNTLCLDSSAVALLFVKVTFEEPATLFDA